jgi:hypothetical protein
MKVRNISVNNYKWGRKKEAQEKEAPGGMLKAGAAADIDAKCAAYLLKAFPQQIVSDEPKKAAPIAPPEK